MRTRQLVLVYIGLGLVTVLMTGCGDVASGDAVPETSTQPAAPAETAAPAEPESSAETAIERPTGESVIDITGAVFSNRDRSCRAYTGEYTASVTDLGREVSFTAHVVITSDGGSCTVTSNGIPNHDFDDLGSFADDVAEVEEAFMVVAEPSAAGTTTGLSLMFDNGVMLDGIKLDELAAACYGVGNEPLGRERIGCFEADTPWRYDPMFGGNDFGTDGHNAHTQPGGAYHYHGDPKALYDDSAGTASGVIGFAADGFPIYGPYIDDGGTIRKLVSGYTLRSGDRVPQDGEGAFPGGTYDGTFIDDYEFTDAGDLDECNGTSRDGGYGYYVTDTYPWVIGCFTGAPNDSFRKNP